MSGPIIDLFLVYHFIKRLVTPFDKTDAFRLGLIDEFGKKLRSPQTQEERRSWGYFDRLIFNLKRLLGKIPLGRTRLASFTAALLLLREQDERLVEDERYLEEQFNRVMSGDLVGQYLMEDAAANATGAAVAGTGSDTVHWSTRQPKVGLKGRLKKYGQPIDYLSFMRRRRVKAA